jgi:hypothetical protein
LVGKAEIWEAHRAPGELVVLVAIAAVPVLVAIAAVPGLVTIAVAAV